MRWTIIAAVTLSIVALAFNTFWVDSRTRAAAPRDGGRIIDTTVVPANAKIEGAGPAIVLLHGFGAAINWWDDIAPELATDHQVIRIDLILLGLSVSFCPTSRTIGLFAGGWRKDLHQASPCRKNSSTT